MLGNDDDIVRILLKMNPDLLHGIHYNESSAMNLWKAFLLCYTNNKGEIYAANHDLR